jgi:hypothetical protein
MSLLDKLLKKLQRTEEGPSEVDFELKDILFDWFNDNNDTIKSFYKNFLEPCIEVYKKNERTKKYIEDYPEKAIEHYFNQHAILYLAANYPDNTRFKILLDYLLSNKNQAYAIKDSIINVPSQYQFQQEETHLWDVLKTGNTIIKIYHAIYDMRDYNISYMSSMSSYLRFLTIDRSENIFKKVIAYFNQQNFSDKLHVLIDAIPPSNKTGYNYNSVSILKNERKKHLDYYNKNNSIEITDTFSQDFEDSFFNIEYTQIYKETSSNKRRYLKLEQFPEATKFISKNSNNKDSIIKYYLLRIGFSRLSSDLTKIHKGLFSEIHRNLNLSKESFLSIINSKIKQNHSLIYNELLAPILKDEVIIGGLTNELVDQFEFKLHQDIIHHSDLIEFQPCFDAILTHRKEDKDEITHSLTVAKYNGLYGGVDFNDYWIMPNISSNKHINSNINQILERLNLLFPSSLKSFDKQNHYNNNKLCTLNIDGKDYDFRSKIIIELNEILRTKKTGYRFLPILIQKRANYRDSSSDQDMFKCSIELLCYSQFKFLNNTQYSQHSVSNSNFIQSIKYQNLEAPLFNYSEKKNTKVSNKISFANNPSWKWFKDKYVDKLESSKKWYPILDLHIQCKGSAKPNKQWSVQINNAINQFGKERYFKELGSLISDSLNESFWFIDNYRVPIKGIIWSCALNPSSESLSIIRSIVEAAYTKIPNVGPKSASLGNLCLNAFVLSKSDEAFGIMNLIRNKSKYQRFIKAIDKSIDKYLEHSTGDAEELADKTIPNFGFKDTSKTILINNNISAVFLIQKNKLSKKWLVDGKMQSTTPSIIKEKYNALGKEVAAEFKRINSVYKQLKERIKTYWLYDRKWKYDFWHKYLFSHPLLKGYLENMIWSNETNGQSFIYKNGDFVNSNNKVIISGSNDIINLWHPVLATSVEVSEWSSFIFTNRINQPLRQVFREHYPFSSEELSNTKSKRFAHHFLTVKKLMAIANSAGWVFTYEHSGDSWPRKFIKPLNSTVHLKCDYSRYDYAIPTKEIYFTTGNTVKLNSTTKIEEKLLSEIPSVTLSEICRDMDLFIATSSIANDPNLSLKTEKEKFYREDFSTSYFSDNASVKVRKQVINIIGPSIGVNPVFEKNYLLVEGKLNKYRINLGSGFAQLSDSQKHINLFPDIQPMKKSKKIHSPIQDDETLYIILAKAKFLINDNQINDPKFIEIISKG